MHISKSKPQGRRKLVSVLAATLAGASLVGTGVISEGTAAAQPPAHGTHARNYLYTSIGDFDTTAKPLLGRRDISGVQVLFPWRMLEPQKGHYDFSEIERVQKVVGAQHKKLFVQLQDRFFQLPPGLPKYLLTDPAYGGGAAPTMNSSGQPEGAIAAQWNGNVRKRFQSLLKALGHRFDGKISGLNLPESAVDVDPKTDKTHYTDAAYFNAELENMAYAKKAFPTSSVIQYINFWPGDWNNDHGLMQRSFDWAEQHGIGVGGPDLLPYWKPQMQNSYPFIHKYSKRLNMVAMAVQEPDFTYRNPRTGKPYTHQEFVDFANNYLGADILFWATSSPWLHQKPNTH
ncbi:hypothetical protein [Actinomadura rupiterrae]|uniref:hypothetical protein n=1 Tax=Actinomadura rupiterrae TaxID=559627 RepID=UPI0020A553D4|nr:hypothetical protein [Actinomadura rupiterrae]MCP2342199.1 hypothetical protein [Actinomadura rupiterrae]